MHGYQQNRSLAHGRFKIQITLQQPAKVANRGYDDYNVIQRPRFKDRDSTHCDPRKQSREFNPRVSGLNEL